MKRLESLFALLFLSFFLNVLFFLGLSKWLILVLVYCIQRQKWQPLDSYSAPKASLKLTPPNPSPPPFFINDFLGNLGLLFHSSAFGSYYSIDDPLTNVTVVFEYSPVLSILTSMDYCYCLCYNAHLCHCKSCNCF